MKKIILFIAVLLTSCSQIFAQRPTSDPGHENHYEVLYAKENNLNLNQSSVRKIICIGENIRETDLSLNTLGKRISESWKVELYSTYASTEQQTAFTECKHGKGGHHHADLLIFEILDDEGNQLPPGVAGELVITTLGVEAMPLLRYNTGDICTYYDEICECGRTTSRLSPVSGRKQQMIKYNGTTLYPQALFNILNSMDCIQDYIINLVKNELGSDNVQIIIALRQGSVNAESQIKQGLQSALRIVPELKFGSLAEIQKLQVDEGKRKINKLIDKRK
jgi:phenylacetate-CoA ligase